MLITVDRLTLQIVLMKIQGYSTHGNSQVSEDYRKGGLQAYGQAERKSEEDLRVVHDNHKAGCENKLHPAYHLLEKMKLLSKPVFENFISNKVQNAVWIAIFMQLFLVALDKIIFRD